MTFESVWRCLLFVSLVLLGVIVVDFGTGLEPGCGLLRSEISLGLTKHLKPNHKLSDGSTPEQRRVEVHMKVSIRMFCGVSCSLCRRLMYSHGVGKQGGEEVVVACTDTTVDVGEILPHRLCEVGDTGDALLGDDEDLEGPASPEWDDCDESIILTDDALFGFHLELDIVFEHVSALLLMILLHVFQGSLGLFGDKLGRPDLTMRVRVRATHHSAFVLKDLNMIDVIELAEGGIFFRPSIDNMDEILNGHFSNSEIELWREANNTALAANSLRTHEIAILDVTNFTRGGVAQECLEIIVKDEGGIIDRVLDGTVDAVVSGTQVVLGIVLWAIVGWAILDAALPRALGAMRGDEDPATSEGIEAAVGMLGVVKGCHDGWAGREGFLRDWFCAGWRVVAVVRRKVC